MGIIKILKYPIKLKDFNYFLCSFQIKLHTWHGFGTLGTLFGTLSGTLGTLFGTLGTLSGTLGTLSGTNGTSLAHF